MILMDDIRALKAAGRFERVNDLIPYASVVGFECRMTADGPLTVLQARESNMGNTMIGAVHGGVVGALLEHAGLIHVMFDSDLPTPPKIINLSIDYLRPVKCDRETLARALVIKQGRRVMNVRIEAWQDDNPARPLAAAHCHVLVG